MATVWSLLPQRSEAPHRDSRRRKSRWLPIISIAIAVISAGYVLRSRQETPPIGQSTTVEPEASEKSRSVGTASPPAKQDRGDLPGPVGQSTNVPDSEIFGKARGIEVDSPPEEGAGLPNIEESAPLGTARGVEADSPSQGSKHDESKGAAVELIIPLVTCLVSTVTALSTLLLNWRADVREQREANFKLAQFAMSTETNGQGLEHPAPRDRSTPKQESQANNRRRSPLSRIANLAKSRLRGNSTSHTRAK